MSESILGIVGGGRWGQVLLSVAAKLFVPFDRIVIVSQENASEVRDNVAILNLESHTPIECIRTLEELIVMPALTAAIVVNPARQHFETALKLIHNGVHILIEKPIVLSLTEMRILVKEALQRRICLVPGLNYRFCSYIKNFSDIAAKLSNLKYFTLEWTDVRNEIRYGKTKRFDTSISVIEDVMPHVWTILSQVFRYTTIEILTCSLEENNSASLTVSINNIQGEVRLKRSGDVRERFLTLQFEQKTLALDFSKEPGLIISDAAKISADPHWDEKLSPLARQLEYFFTQIRENESNPEDLQSCLDSVACTEAATMMITTVA